MADAALLFNHTHILVSPSAHLPKKENDFIIIFSPTFPLFVFPHSCNHTDFPSQQKKNTLFYDKKKETENLYLRGENFFTRDGRNVFGVCVEQ